MASLQRVADMPFPPESTAVKAASAWSRWLGGLMGSARSRVRRGRAARVPVYRITRLAEDRWVVERPGAAIEHAFPDLEQAVAFIRHECPRNLATVELRVDDLYVVAQLDPSTPASLFGESVLQLYARPHWDVAHRRFLDLDPASSLVLRRFAIAVPVITVWAVVVDPQDPLPMLAAMMLVAAVTDALLAVLRGHVFNGASLNYWDGASGFFAAHCLARALS